MIDTRINSIKKINTELSLKISLICSVLDRIIQRAEAANKRLNTKIGVKHPKIKFVVFYCFQKVQIGWGVIYSKFKAGKNPHKKFKINYSCG